MTATTQPAEVAPTIRDAGDPRGHATYGEIVQLAGTAPAGAQVQISFHVFGQNGYDIRRTVTATSGGTYTTTYQAVADERYYAQAGGATSAGGLTTVAPYVRLPAQDNVTRYSTVTVTGESTSGSSVTVYFHPQGSPAGSYFPRRIPVARANGPFSKTFTADKDYRIVVQGADGLVSGSHLIHTVAPPVVYRAPSPTPPPTSSPSGVRYGVQPGAFCTPAGAHGYTSSGRYEVCGTTSASPDRARWHQA